MSYSPIWQLHACPRYLQSCRSSCTFSKEETGWTSTYPWTQGQTPPWRLSLVNPQMASWQGHTLWNQMALIMPWSYSSLPYVDILTGIPIVLSFCQVGLSPCNIGELPNDQQCKSKSKNTYHNQSLHSPVSPPAVYVFWNSTCLSEVQWAEQSSFSFIPSSTTRIAVLESMAVEKAVLSHQVVLIERNDICTNASPSSAYT